MASAARATRASAQHSRLRRRAQLLTDEVGRLGESRPQDSGSSALELHVVPKPASTPFNIESFLDRAVDLTKGWEKIAALVALITTNLSGNKSLGALLEIMAKDKVLPTTGTSGGSGVPSFGNLNITELLGMAENLLKTGQLPAGLQVPVPPAPEQVSSAQTVEGEVIEATIAEAPSTPSESEGSIASEAVVADEYSEPADLDGPVEVEDARD